MSSKNAFKAFQDKLPAGQLKLNEPLAKHTTLKIGGPADILFAARSEDQLLQALKLAQESDIPYVVLGWGSNVLISDTGFRGLVIKNQSNDIKLLGKADSVETQNSASLQKTSEQDRHDHAIIAGKEYSIKFDDLDYDESSLPTQLVEVSSGVVLSNLITWTLDHNLTGLQWYNRIPGTVGGAIFNNIHGGSHYIEEVLHSVKVLNQKGEVLTLSKADLNYGYDQSRFHDSGEIILSAIFNLHQGDIERAKHVALEWAKRKSIQPHNSAGCTFQNISQADRDRLKYPTTSIGYIVEWVLKWSGKQIGDAKIYEKHNAFIINEGQAKAADVLNLIKQIQAETLSKTGVKLKPEIFFIGFTDQELEGVY